MRFWLPALVAITVIPVGAHHPFASYYQTNRLVTMAGPIVELRTSNPHVVLIVEGKAPDGRTGRWAFEGLPPHAYQSRGLTDYKERLTPGTIVEITGWPATDPEARAFTAREIRFADRTTMPFGISVPPSGEDGWTCGSPCSYTYPVP